MATRGRKSASSLTVVKPDIWCFKTTEPTVLHLSDAEMSVWAQVVNDQPVDSFTMTHSPMLEMYCRHVVNNRIIADELLSSDRHGLLVTMV